MTIDYQDKPAKLIAGSINIDNILQLSSKSQIGASHQTGRRARKRKLRAASARVGLLAPLLAAEGCKTLGKDDIDLGAAGGAPAGGGTDAGAGAATGIPPATGAAQNDFFMGETNNTIELTVDDILANDDITSDGSLELVRVFDAVNGTVVFDGAVVQFIPAEDFAGNAHFSYEVRDENGDLHIARVDFHIAGEDGHGDGDHGGGDHGGGDHGGHVHPDDPSKASEHTALLSLVPVSDATHIAVNNGSWFDPNTWAGGEVPGEGAQVLISDGVRVTYDAESDVSLFTVRVDGMLEFSTSKDTFMEVDTFIVSPSGHLTIGTIDHPVHAGVEAVIQIADNGPIDTHWDTHLLSRGVISHGKIEVHGAEKETFLKVADDPMRGDTSLTLEEAPEGWQVGDALVLTGTHLPDLDGKQANAFDPETVTQDEELVITSIVGNTIHFDRALEYDHDGPRADLKAYVANFSRNVKIQTENFDDVPVHQRGHVMLMHSDDIDVRYGEFLELGRTDKSVRAFDIDDLSTVESDSNVKGRYSLHIHRAGVSDLDDPAMLVGNAIWGSPGWGVTHHDSNAVIVDNAVYDAFGSAFVAETGNETGRWSHNIAIKSIGSSSGPKDGPDVIAFDNARGGSGFWFQGRAVDSVDNVAAGIPSGHGFVYMSRGQGFGSLKHELEDVPHPETLRYRSSGEIYQPAISSFIGNEAIAVQRGFEVIKPGPKQAHDERSIISDFTAWEVEIGIFFQYTAHYTVENLDIIAARDPGIGGTFGLLYHKNTIDFTVNGARIDGFDTGVRLDKEILLPDFDGNFEYAFIDVDFVNIGTEFTGLDGGDRILTSADLTDVPVTYVPDAPGVGELSYQPGEAIVKLSGVKTDGLGDARIGTSWESHSYDYQSLKNAIELEGWWTLPDGRSVTVFEQYISDRLTGDLIKVANVVAFDPSIPPTDTPENYNGVFDVGNAAPIGVADSAIVSRNGSVVIDVLANDSDPDAGDIIRVDGIQYAENGGVFVNPDGTITYTPDPNFTGTDEFWYWVEDDNANLTKTHVQITVDI